LRAVAALRDVKKNPRFMSVETFFNIASKPPAVVPDPLAFKPFIMHESLQSEALKYDSPSKCFFIPMIVF
jgi:hypothetical protein